MTVLIYVFIIRAQLRYVFVCLQSRTLIKAWGTMDVFFFLSFFYFIYLLYKKHVWKVPRWYCKSNGSEKNIHLTYLNVNGTDR